MSSENMAAALYLDLLKRCLTNTVFADEPDHEDTSLRFVQRFIAHYIKGNAVTMLPIVALDNLQFCITDVIARGVPGDLIETGVWRGGASIFMRAVLKAHGIFDRRVWVADSFEGMPEPDADKFPLEAKSYNGPIMTNVYNKFAVGIDEVKDNFEQFGMLDSAVQFLKGWFKDTLPAAPIERLSVMRLDGDYYESTMDALTNLYHKLSPGGYVIIDDYGEDAWTYCRKAVDEFRASHGINGPLIRVDRRSRYWQRSS
jgi:hypothetical protein